jgi:hypothetical protein
VRIECDEAETLSRNDDSDYLTARPSRDLVVASNQQITRQWWEQQRQKFDVCVSQFDEVSCGHVVLAGERLEALKGSLCWT